ncbi:MAG: SUMF1/EgtB/PvdO family nonheme iron enzyme [Verrucomicrobia bacterium]|nr:SUMF1/EgtB/PvdO family nonheme iron enzyme [Verrucomicrobiota bacterium]
MVVKCAAAFPIPLPDDPKKWEGWSNYKSDNPYERLCLDPRQNPSNELIEEHCRELLRWWQKKLPLKNQPSNPVAQLLRIGLDESSRYLTEARVELLDPQRRRRVDQQLANEAHAQALTEFQKFLAFTTADGTLSENEEKSLRRFGAQQGLAEDELLELVEKEVQARGVVRVQPPEPPAPEIIEVAAPIDPKTEFRRMLRLSGLDNISMTDDQRDAFINVAENSGIDAAEAEDMVDEYLEELEQEELVSAAATKPVVLNAKTTAKAEEPSAPAAVVPQISPEEERRRFTNFTNSIGSQMFLIPSGEFIMGSNAPDAPPNETPQFPVTVTRFYMSRFPVTNAQYEEFDPLHERKRAPGTGPQHPVVYVSSLDAMKFCQWLTTRERRKYRLPSEAEWEYAAKGNDGRIFPWGAFARRGDLANFADKNTVFAWSDREIDDGYAESAPVGAFPRGASPFGIEDMAGNVWEWCSDYYETYKALPKVNPHGPPHGNKRVYRGGSWKSRFASLRTTTRNANAPNYSCNDLGFRVVCECDP